MAKASVIPVVSAHVLLHKLLPGLFPAGPPMIVSFRDRRRRYSSILLEFGLEAGLAVSICSAIAFVAARRLWAAL